MAHPTDEHVESGTKTIWKTFWILLGITILDFILYFTLPATTFRNWLFIIFALIKAYFIVGVFMHLKYEKVTLILVILVPILFIIGLVAGLLYEGDYWSSYFGQ